MDVILQSDVRVLSYWALGMALALADIYPLRNFGIANANAIARPQCEQTIREVERFV